MDNYEDNVGGKETQPAESRIRPHDALIGVTLEGRYLIEKRLGQGGFGMVYLASDNKIEPRKVVVKIMHATEVGNEWSQYKFEQEVKALSLLDHPGIVELFDCGETADGRPYIVMQYIDGQSLRSLLQPDGMPIAVVARIIRQVGNAVSAAHQAGILHRDLKPENIMVKIINGEEHAKVIDFGIAKIKDSLVNVHTAKGRVPGTIIYMSPEQLEGQPATSESDIYALGLIAYEMLTGRRPDDAESAFQPLKLQRSGVRAKPTALRPDLPKTVDDIVLKALSFEKRHRYQDAREFGEALAISLAGTDRPKFREQPSEVSDGQIVETAHVLFVDIVGYSKLLIDDQTQQQQKLKELVLGTGDCRELRAPEDLIFLPTGDGLALVFFKDPEAPVRVAAEIGRVLKSNPVIRLRMGIHSGIVNRIADINTNLNVAGGGINVAQRVMDCGDTGHILMSKRVADDLVQLARWSEYITDLGEAEVKHGDRIHLYNLSGSDFGNPELPAKLLRKRHSYKEAAAASIVVLIVLALIVGIWFRNSVATTSNTSQNTATIIPPANPERTLFYSILVQETRNNQPVGEPIRSAGDIQYEKDWKIQLNVQPKESGSLYLLNAGRAYNGGEKYNILYPIPVDGKTNPNVEANQTARTIWLQFMNDSPREKMWLIWSINSLPDLNAIFGSAAENNGEVTNAADIKQIENYIEQYSRSKPTVEIDKSREITSIKGNGDILVALIELSAADK